METRECGVQAQLLRLETSVEQSRQQQKSEMEELAKQLKVTKQARGAMQETLPVEAAPLQIVSTAGSTGMNDASGTNTFLEEMANFTHEARSMLEALNRRCSRLEEKILQSALATSRTPASPHLNRALEQEP